MKVEQRIGRIDRIGQKHPVKIFNFSTVGTIEERVVEVLTNRIGVFEETIGGLDPILGEVESDLKKIFLAADREAERELAALERATRNRASPTRASAEEHLRRPHHGHALLPQGRGRAAACSASPRSSHATCRASFSAR